MTICVVRGVIEKPPCTICCGPRLTLRSTLVSAGMCLSYADVYVDGNPIIFALGGCQAYDIGLWAMHPNTVAADHFENAVKNGTQRIQNQFQASFNSANIDLHM